MDDRVPAAFDRTIGAVVGLEGAMRQFDGQLEGLIVRLAATATLVAAIALAAGNSPAMAQALDAAPQATASQGPGDAASDPASAADPMSSTAAADAPMTDDGSKVVRTLYARKQSANGIAAPAPMATDAPEEMLVICHAGCNQDALNVVVLRKPLAPEQQSTYMQVTSDGGAANNAEAPMVVCMGGCFDTPSFYIGAPGEAASVPSLMITSEREASTGVAPGQSGDWMVKINRAQDGAGASGDMGEAGADR